jgi:hypothetical protein
MATIDSDTESESDADSDSVESYADSYSTETTNDYSYEYELNHHNAYVLRGLRFFTNQIENLENNEEDESNEEDEIQLSRLPTVSHIGNKILESGITLHDLVGAIMSINIEYKIHSAMVQRYSTIWQNLNDIITTEVCKEEVVVEQELSSVEVSQQEMTSDEEPIITVISEPEEFHKFSPNKKIMYFTTIDEIRRDLKINYSTH